MSASQASASAGVAFAGVPEEMREGAAKLAAREPDHEPPQVNFDPVADPSALSGHRLNLRQLFWPKRWAVLVGLGLLVAETVTMLVGPVVVQQGIDNGVIAGNTAVLNTVVVVFLATVAANVGLSLIRQRHNGAVAESLMFGLRMRLFNQYQRLSLGWYTNQKTGALLSTMTSDVEYVALLVNEGFVNLIIQALTVLVVSVVLFIYNPTLAVVLLFIVMPPLVGLTLWFRSAATRGYSRVRDRLAGVLADLSENLAGIRVVRALNRHRRNNVNHGEAVDGYLRANLDASRAAATYGPATEALGIAAQGVMVLVGGAMVLRGSLRPGELAAFVLFVTTFFAPIQQLVQLYNIYQQGNAGLSKIGRILALRPTVGERADAYDLPATSGEIVFSDVSFAYDDAAAAPERSVHPDPVANGAPEGHPTDVDGGAGSDEPADPDEHEVLHHIDLHIRPGETFALVGPTGAGKSTIAKLITRFYDPTAGTVTIDGHDLRDVTLGSLRNQLGVVPQEPFLFNGSVRDNIAMAADNVTDEQVAAAVEAVGLADTIAALGEGLNTPVHERGVSLSAGERQLLALARAFVANPAVIVLDEATSSLDLLSESRIETALDAVTEGRTTVLIAHRLATAQRADRIGVVEDGSLVELGSHEELVELGGRYAQMHETWRQHASPAAAPA